MRHPTLTTHFCHIRVREAPDAISHLTIIIKTA